MSDDKLVKEVIKYAKNHKVLSKMDLDFTKDFSKINEYKNAEERGENVSIKRDFQGRLRVKLISSEKDFQNIEDFKNNVHIYEQYIKPMENIIEFEDFICQSDGHTKAKGTFLRILEIFKKDLNTKFNIGLYIYGPSGLGKTTISKTFTYHLKKLGVDAEVLKANTISTITENFNPINTLKTKKVLTIDDIGIGYITPFYLAQLIELLDYRVEKGLLTFFNSNYSKERLYNFFEKNSNIEYAQRLYSRIETLAEIDVFFEEEKEI